MPYNSHNFNVSYISYKSDFLTYVSNVLYFQRVISYPMIIIALIGTISNSLTFAVFMRKKFEKYSFPIYFKFMAISDTIVLIHSISFPVAILTKFNVQISSELACKLTDYVKFVSGTISLLLLTLIGFDRMLTITLPQKFKALKKKHIQILLIFIICIGCIGVYICLPLNTHLTKHPYFNRFKNQTIILSVTCDINNLSLNNIGIVIELIPVLLVNNVLTTITILYVFKSRAKFANNASRLLSSTQRRTLLRDLKFAINAITLNLFSFTCKSPYLLYVYYVQYISIPLVCIIQAVVLLLFAIDNASSFFVNILVNSLFRDEFLIMIKIKKPPNSNVT